MALSLDPKDLLTVVCRPALPKDTPDVLEFTKRIWDGNDYLPYVWEDWLRDPLGILVAAEYGRKVVGVGKLTFMAPGEWWLEGLRVDPDYQGQKIASHLHEYLVEMWEKNCDGILRLTTTSNRFPVHHLCERTGFYRKLEVGWFAAEPIQDEEVTSLISLERGEIPEALDYIWQSPVFQLSNGLVDADWHWEDLRVEHLEKAVEENLVYWLPDRKGLLLVRRDTDEDGEFIHIAAAACAYEDLPGMLWEYRRLAGRLGFEKANWGAPLREEILPLLEEAGFKPSWDLNIFVFEKPAPEDL